MAQHWGIKAHYCCVNDTESGALDFLLSAGDRRLCDPAAWPQWAEGRAATELFICLTLAQPVMELGGCCWCCWAGFSEHMENCVGVEDLRGAGRLGRADKGRPQQAETDPSFTFSMRCCLTISSADTNCLISQLISDSKHRSLQQIPDGGGGTVEWLIKGGQWWPCWMPGLRQLRAPAPALPLCQPQQLRELWDLTRTKQQPRLPGSYRPVLNQQPCASSYLLEQLISQSKGEADTQRCPTQSQVTFPVIGFLE